MEEEFWADIAGYYGKYQVSTLGRVRTFPKVVMRNKLRTTSVKVRIVPQRLTEKGYLRADLRKDGKLTRHRVHRLVAIAFLPNPKHKPQVNHKNNDRKDNGISNLVWGTASENNQHAFDCGNNYRGESHYSSKLTEDHVREIINLLDTTSMLQKDIALKFNVNSVIVNCIHTGKTWVHVTGRQKWKRRPRGVSPILKTLK